MWETMHLSVCSLRPDHLAAECVPRFSGRASAPQKLLLNATVPINEYLYSQEDLPMNRTIFGLRSIVCAALLSTVAVFAQQIAVPSAGPVPPAILAAKKIFVSNAGGDSGLFPSPFSGDPSRGYTEFYTMLKAAGHYDLVTDPGEADLVLELQLSGRSSHLESSSVNKVNGSPDPLPMFRLVVYDRKSHYVLWTLTQSIEVAYLQKSHDRNFDDALNALVRDFQAISGKSPAIAH